MDDASRLCTNCGMCCDGSLFDHALVAEGEEETIRAAGLQIVAGDDGKVNFQLPCHYLEQACCTRYETRFHVCRSFKCELLHGMRNGKVAPDAAMATVEEAKRLLAVAETHLGEAPTRGARRSKMRELRDLQAIPPGPARDAAAAARLDLMTLRLFLDRHFHRRVDEKAKVAG